MESYREPFLQRAKDCAEVTIPALMPYWVAAGATNNITGSNTLPTPWQSVGARGVNNLASKLMLALLPPESPFFRLSVDAEAKKELDELNEDPQADKEGAREEALANVERTMMDEIETYGLRSDVYEVGKQLLNSGNILLHLGEDESRVFKLNEYVVKRNPKGKVLEIVTREFLSRSSLSPTLLALVGPPTNPNETEQDRGVEDDVPLYTWVRREGNRFKIHQEIEDKIIPGTSGTEKVKETSWLALRLTKIDGEDYGRSHVEEYLGDLNSLEILSQALTEGAAAAAKILWFVEPGGITNAKKIAKARNGAFIPGRAKDISALQMDKFADMTVADRRADTIERRLSAVFLLTSEMPRDAERVTAEEIRLIAAELEDALGGAYSLFSKEFQRPLARWVMARLRRKKVLEPIFTKNVDPKIVTGLEALGRNNEIRKRALLLQNAAAFGPEAVAEYVKIGHWLQRDATSLNIDMEGVLRSEEEVQEARARKAQAEAEAALGPEVIKQAGQQAQPQQ
jgi:hypothetical protein